MAVEDLRAVSDLLGDKPYLLGLDSGCVYGNQLSAYILEEARLVRVPSRQQQDEWLQRDA